MKFVVAAKAPEVPPGEMKSLEVDGTKVLLANVGGSFYAIQGKCPHMGADLCKGRLNGHIVSCPKHHAEFDVRDGSAVNPAKLLFLKMKTKNAQSFPIKMEGDAILVAV